MLDRTGRWQKCLPEQALSVCAGQAAQSRACNALAHRSCLGLSSLANEYLPRGVEYAYPSKHGPQRRPHGRRAGRLIKWRSASLSQEGGQQGWDGKGGASQRRTAKRDRSERGRCAVGQHARRLPHGTDPDREYRDLCCRPGGSDTVAEPDHSANRVGSQPAEIPQKPWR